MSCASPLPPSDLPRQCSYCGAVPIDDACTCLGMAVWEHRRDEGDDAVAEERAEREAAWREGPSS